MHKIASIGHTHGGNTLFVYVCVLVCSWVCESVNCCACLHFCTFTFLCHMYLFVCLYVLPYVCVVSATQTLCNGLYISKGWLFASVTLNVTHAHTSYSGLRPFLIHSSTCPVLLLKNLSLYFNKGIISTPSSLVTQADLIGFDWRLHLYANIRKQQ